jgi:vacuolar-type H+-ATPase subunit H
MRDVIQKVVETETEAKRIVQAAMAEAELIRSAAQKQARNVVTQARQEARMETEKLLAAAIQEAEQEKKERLARAAAEIDTHVRLDSATVQRAAEAAARCVRGASKPVPE